MATVLLIEDNEFNSDMLSRRLRRSGWDVTIAQDGLQALNLAPRSQFDIILMDMSLPALDGWQVTEILKGDNRTRMVPIIALTAHAMTGDKERALDAGCDEFEPKPINFHRLLEKMSALSEAARCARSE